MNKQNTLGDNIVVIKLNEHKVPQFKEVRGEDYIFFGKNNDYPDYLLTLYNRSAKHNAIINQKAFYVFGGGSVVGETLKANEDGEFFNDVMRKVILDYELFGGFAVEVIWSYGGTIAEIRHVNYSHVRSNEDNSKFYYTKGWVKKYYDEFDNETRLPAYTAKDNKDFVTWDAFHPTSKTGKQLYYYKCYRPDLDIYSLPDYIGSIPYIEIDFEIANFWYNAVKNGFTASHIITFYGDAGTPEQQKTLEERITKKFTGTDKAGKIILNFSQNKEKGGSEIANIVPQDLDKQFNILNQTVQQEIFSGHRITSPMLFGIKTPGQLGGRTEMIEAAELFQNIYATPKQKIFETVFTKFASLSGSSEKIELQKLKPIGIDLVNNINAWQILTTDEQREEIGKEPINKDKKSAEVEKVLSNVQSISPLVANEVLKSMTTNEIRGGVGLPPVAGGDKIPVPLPVNPNANPDKGVPPQFSKMNPINVFKKFSSHRKGKLIDSRPLEFNDTINLKAQEEKFADLKGNQRSVLDLLSKDPLMPASEIAKTLKISEQRVNNIITLLKTRELIEESKDKSGGGSESVPALTPVKDAQKILDESPAPTANIFVVYSYEWRDGFSDEDADSSREICLDLMAESKQREAEGRLWTRDEINAIGAELGFNAWEMRGGWYTKPGTDIHLPFCRHIWTQHLYTVE